MTGKPKNKPGGHRLDETGEFFSIGGPLHPVRAGYVKRPADDRLYDMLVAGRYAHVLAPERSGKSSLIAATAARLENNGCRIAVLDLEQIGVRDGGSDAGRWYYSVAYRLLRQLRIRYDLQTWWQDKSILSNRQRLVEFYSEVVLEHIEDRVVVFVDDIQCIERLSFADQLLVSIRAAHNARTTDPDFSRLTFVLSGECDPLNLIQEAELSPFSVTEPVVLDDFQREELKLFATELNLAPEEAELALDRIHYWTAGQPYLCQKLARAVAREPQAKDVEAQIDHIALHQLAGRAALHSEPHMSHIHRRIVADDKLREPLLNLYGKMRKGIPVAADLGSALQRHLIAVGLVTVDGDGNLAVRNRLYASVFTARWANENLPSKLRVPAMVAAALLLIGMVPFWYTQWLPNPYVRILASDDTSIDVGQQAFENLSSFPGHADTAQNLFVTFLRRRAERTGDVRDIERIAAALAQLPNVGRLPDDVLAGFWDRKMRMALRAEDRDAALLASLRSLAVPTSGRRQRAASLVGEDYPLLLATLPELPQGRTVFDADNRVLTTASGAEIRQWSWSADGAQSRQPWTMTALEVSPLVRRVAVDQEGSVRRIGLTLNISHGRLSDLRVRVIAPSGRAVDIETGMERASSGNDIRIPASQLRDFIGESLSGTWSLSVRDEGLGVAGQLVGWSLNLNSQGVVEQFQRGLNVPDPVERETDNVWFDPSGRYAVARAVQSDSARVWDLSFAEAVRAVAVGENETLIGLAANARLLITATQDSVNVWDTGTGDILRRLPVGAASLSAQLTPDRTGLFVEHRGDAQTRFELWSLQEGVVTAEITVAGSPAMLALDGAARRVAIADFDQAVRLWDVRTNELLAQFDLSTQPSDLRLSASGDSLGAVYANNGFEVWNAAQPDVPLISRSGAGEWRLSYSPSGNLVAAGRAGSGYQIYDGRDGRQVGPAIGMQTGDGGDALLEFTFDEKLLITGHRNAGPRIWRVPSSSAEARPASAREYRIWRPAADRPVLVSPDTSTVIIGDADGHVYFLPASGSNETVRAAAADVSFVGHSSAITRLAIDTSGDVVASVADDNSVRVWQAATGAPRGWVHSRSGAVHDVLFSPDASVAALQSDEQVVLLDTDNGSTIAAIDAGDPIGSVAFARNDRLYIGTRQGALLRAQQHDDGAWNLQQVWQGEGEVRHLEASPRGDLLLMVNSENVVSQFVLSAGEPSAETLRLPSPIQDVSFEPRGSTVYLRTNRWVHRAVATPSGLRWSDATLIPVPLKGAAVVFRASDASGSTRALLPIVRNGYPQFADLQVTGSGAAGLLGSRAALLDDWIRRTSEPRPTDKVTSSVNRP